MKGQGTAYVMRWRNGRARIWVTMEVTGHNAVALTVLGYVLYEHPELNCFGESHVCTFKICTSEKRRSIWNIHSKSYLLWVLKDPFPPPKSWMHHVNSVIIRLSFIIKHHFRHTVKRHVQSLRQTAPKHPIQIPYVLVIE